MKASKKSEIQSEGLSVVVPTYNGSSWLEETISKISQALKFAGITKCEIVVINDGSTDDTVKVVKKIIKTSTFAVRLVTQANGGRFVARRTGTNEATYPNLLFVDTRVYIGEESLSYLLKKHQQDSTRNVWCSHVRVDSKGNIYAKFWDAIAFIAWRKYFKNPRDISYGIEEFDDYPKGTTCFFIKKSILAEANEWFEKNTYDLKTSNDDTLLIRHIAESSSINISPDFWCMYHARSSMKQYVKHVHHRGQVFVDGFLRNDGNRFFYPLIAFLVLSVLVPVYIAFNVSLLPMVLVLGVVCWAIELVAILLTGVPLKDGLSLFVLSPIFGLYYGTGIWRASFRTLKQKVLS
ncbi:MAG: glycosyltransferase family 2 protein [Candidatus Saccharibacteria bacterium]|nr:glycosyltransferase family 2 protein [Candidatus Saccharibacteria bacterium]